MTAQNNPPAVECYKGKLRFEKQFSMVVADGAGSFAQVSNSRTMAQDGEELARRWNAYDAHVATIAELREALNRIDDLCHQPQSSDWSCLNAISLLAESTLAKSQAKGSL